MFQKQNAILEKSFQFSKKLIVFTDVLQSMKKFNLANQLFRSGTAIGALVNEAQSPESRGDFIHKLKIAAKEAQETKYWLHLCSVSDNYPDPKDLLGEIDEINKLLSAIISSTKNNMAEISK